MAGEKTVSKKPVAPRAPLMRRWFRGLTMDTKEGDWNGSVGRTGLWLSIASGFLCHGFAPAESPLIQYSMNLVWLFAGYNGLTKGRDIVQAARKPAE